MSIVSPLRDIWWHVEQECAVARRPVDDRLRRDIEDCLEMLSDMEQMPEHIYSIVLGILSDYWDRGGGRLVLLMRLLRIALHTHRNSVAKRHLLPVARASAVTTPRGNK